MTMIFECGTLFLFCGRRMDRTQLLFYLPPRKGGAVTEPAECIFGDGLGRSK